MCVSTVSILQRVGQQSVFYSVCFSSQCFTVCVSAVSVLQRAFQQSIFYNVYFSSQYFTACVSSASVLQRVVQQSVFYSVPLTVEPTDFNEQLELVSGQRLHLEDIEAIVCKVKVLDKYKQPSAKCAKLKSKYFRKVVDELMKRWS